MLTLGFSNVYFTLWEVSEPYKKYSSGSVINGVFSGSFEIVQDCNYKQNLSHDYNEALTKITEISGNKFNIDLELKGSHNWTRGTGIKGNDTPLNVFTFGKLQGQEFDNCKDIWQLERAANQEIGKRRRVLARRRLINLGELIRYNRKWLKPTQIEFLKAKELENELSGHYFEDGKRIKLTIKRIGGFSFDGQYGTTFIEKYLTDDGKLIKYMGSNPPNINDEFINIMATIKHDEYKGQPETKLQRIKII